MPGLRLDIEFLTGRYAAADAFAREQTEWPPAPARVFAALAAAAFEVGDAAALQALEWLETQTPLCIRAGDPASQRGRLASTGDGPPKHFVPVNDTARDLSGKIVRAGRQPRLFPSLALADPLVQLVWPDAQPTAEQLSALQCLASLVSYVGESASAVRLAWTEGQTVQPNLVPDANGRVMLRVPFRGQLKRFADNFRAGRNPAAGVQQRYAWRHPADAKPTSAKPAPARQQSFIFRLEKNPGLCVTHGLHLTAAVRQALVALAEQAGHRVPPILHGHADDGGRLRQDHVKIGRASCRERVYDLV